MITNRNDFLILISKETFMKYLIATIMALFATVSFAADKPAEKKEAPKAEAKKEAPKADAKKDEKKEAPKK